MKQSFHVKSPGNWINDPNGFIYYGGKYHLFYQFFPYEPKWGTMHWGHAVSDNLIDWEHIGVALYPTKEYDKNGIFSGSAIEIDGKLCLYYTAVKYPEENPENIHVSNVELSIQSQAMITSKDGITFDNYSDKRLIIPPVEDKNIADYYECRDPKVWKQGDTYYMCLASTYERKEGVLVIFKSKDGINFTYHNRLQSKDFGTILECPDLFECDGRWVFYGSFIGNYIDSEYPDNQAIIQLVDCDIESGVVKLLGDGSDEKVFDYGMDLYAPQSNIDKDGNRTVIAWARMEAPKAYDYTALEAGNISYNNAKAWSGLMCLPRIVKVKDNTIYTSVHPNVRQYFESESEAVGSECSNITSIVRRDGNDRIIAHISEGESFDINGFVISMKDGSIHTDRSAYLLEGMTTHRFCHSPYIGKNCELEIYDSEDIIEIYINDGMYVITNVKY